MSASLVLAAIPSPSSNAIEIGPLTIRAYGLAIGIGVVAAVLLAQRRWEARGGDAADIGSVAVWAVPAGFVGARLYHVLTDWHRFEGRWWHALAVWEGGLGIPGGLLAGVVTGVVVARRRLRIDPATELAGVRVNTWVSSIVLLAALAVLAVRGRRGRACGATARLGSADIDAERPTAASDALSCQQVARVLQSFLDEEADPDTVGRIEEHLEQCRRCGMEASVYLEIKESLARAAPSIPELTRRRLRRFGEGLGVPVGGHPRGSGL